MSKRPFNGSPTVDGYYTTFDSSEVHRVQESSDDHGGGGSSDFSTAEVTITDSVSVLRFCAIFDDEEWSGIEQFSGAVFNDETYTIPLYKGNCIIYKDDAYGTVAVTGDIVYDENGSFEVTGNGTITISQVAQG